MWTIKLRDGIKFHDGTALDATVVKNNLDAYRGKYPAAAAAAVRVRVPGHRERRRRRPAHGDGHDEAPVGRVPVVPVGQRPPRDHGPGPARLDELQRRPHRHRPVHARRAGPSTTAFVATKNPNYWAKDADGNQLPYLDKITFKPLEDERARLNALRGRRVHTRCTRRARSSIEEIREQGRRAARSNNVESDKFGEVGYIMLNAAKPPFDNLTARQVLAYGIDRRSVNEIRADNIPTLAQGPFAPGNVGYLEDAGFPEYDAQKAKDLVAQYKEETGSPLTFTLHARGRPGDARQTAQLYPAAAWSDIGVNGQPAADRRPERADQRRDRWRVPGRQVAQPPGRRPRHAVRVVAQRGDATAVRNPVNFGRFNDPEINRLLDEGRTDRRPGEAQDDLRGPQQAVRRAVVEHLGAATRSGRSPASPTSTACSARTCPTAADRSRVSPPVTRSRACG